MCFSTTASFVSGSVLTAIGVASFARVKYSNQILLACIPFVFAVQQFSEGFVWLSLLDDSYHSYQKLATTFFLFFAIVVWPAWVPCSFFLIETERVRKIILGVISIVGLLFSVLSTYYLFNYDSVASIIPYHIHYELDIPYKIKVVIGISYIVPTIVSHFVSSNKKVVLMGVCVLLSYFITRLYFNEEVISVWCFFSALISMVIFYILKDKAVVLHKSIQV